MGIRLRVGVGMCMVVRKQVFMRVRMRVYRCDCMCVGVGLYIIVRMRLRMGVRMRVVCHMHVCMGGRICVRVEHRMRVGVGMLVCACMRVLCTCWCRRGCFGHRAILLTLWIVAVFIDRQRDVRG